MHTGENVWIIGLISYSSVQLPSHVRLFVTPWTAACQAAVSITNSWSLLKLMSINSRCHSTISSSVVPFFSCPQLFPVSGSFPVSQFFTSGGISPRQKGFKASPYLLAFSGKITFPTSRLRQTWAIHTNYEELNFRGLLNQLLFAASVCQHLLGAVYILSMYIASMSGNRLDVQFNLNSRWTTNHFFFSLSMSQILCKKIKPVNPKGNQL